MRSKHGDDAHKRASSKTTRDSSVGGSSTLLSGGRDKRVRCLRDLVAEAGAGDWGSGVCGDRGEDGGGGDTCCAANPGRPVSIGGPGAGGPAWPVGVRASVATPPVKNVSSRAYQWK